MNDSGKRRPNRIERYDTIVIGGGQAGLAVGYHLARSDADFLVLDSAARVGESWRRRWDSLRLFTPAAYSGLPGMPFPGARNHLPDKDEVADYLERYAQRFDIPVRSNSRVASLSREGRRYVVDTGTIRYEANQVVVATGPLHTPRIPRLATEISADIHQLHSSQYRNPFELPDGPVLVVGAGNSGAQIALEVSRFRETYLAGANTGQLPRTLLGRDIYQWLWPLLTRMARDSMFGRQLQRRLSHDPLVGISEAQLSRAGIRRIGRVTGVESGRPVTDGQAVAARTIIWCTGYAPDFSWIRLPLTFDRGNPRTRRGVVDDLPGLYFVGLRFLHRLTSALLGGVGDDAAHIARLIMVGEAE